MGVPVFAARLGVDGEPDGRDRRWNSWQKKKPDHSLVDEWVPGLGLCAVTGTVFDVLDMDPRNGGRFSFKAMADELGDDGPEVYWEVATPSGGRHVWVAPLGIGSHKGFLRGMDLKAEGGFVFIPPTVRPSKDPESSGTRRRYLGLTPLLRPRGSGSVDALRRFVESVLAERAAGSGLDGGGRPELDALEQACLRSEAGQQRSALMALCSELERLSDDREYVVWRLGKVAARMPAFNKKRPWREKDLRGLLHRPGAVVADATAAERRELAELRLRPLSASVVSSGLTAYSDVEARLSRWLWLRWLAFGDFALLDGDEGKGKSLVTIDIAARATRGRPMPLASGVPDGVGPINVLLLAPEDRAEVTRGRLEAAGADLARVFRPAVGVAGRGPSRGKAVDAAGHLMTFPDSVGTFRKWITEYKIGLVILDPVTAFLSERVNSNNDASVRRALEPMSLVLGDLGASALGIRHLNKNTDQAAAMRGGGSVAFGAVSRVRVFCGELPPSAQEGENAGARFGLTQLKNSHLRRAVGETLCYSIEDSSVVADMDGNFAPRLVWHGTASVSADDMAGKSSSSRHGPDPIVQEELAEVLRLLFDGQDTWPSASVLVHIKDAGLAVSRPTIDKVRKRLGIVSQPVYTPGEGGVKGWEWTTHPRKEHVGKWGAETVSPAERRGRRPVREPADDDE